jgi:ethanolamine ammonia-lyase small subunit
MANDSDPFSLASNWPEIVRRIRARTPARLLVGHSGAAYRTATQLDLREAHAAARDAVQAELDLKDAFGAAFVTQWGLFEAATQAKSKGEYLLRPDLGRHFNNASRVNLLNRCSSHNQIQMVIGDGLSVPAVKAQVPSLLPLLDKEARERGWTIGQPFVIRYCRVGILNEIGELLNPQVAVLLIGERPGLATIESLSAYMAYQPKQGHSDADRNLISNIHSRGVTPPQAAVRIVNLASMMMDKGTSGCGIREKLPELE